MSKSRDLHLADGEKMNIRAKTTPDHTVRHRKKLRKWGKQIRKWWKKAIYPIDTKPYARIL